MSLTVPLAIFGTFAISELALIVVVALLVFGGRLPEVALRAAAQVMRARKVVTKMWRDAGLEQELRRVQWEIESKLPRDVDIDIDRKYGDSSAREQDSHHPEEGHEHLEEGDEGLDPAIGFGAPSGTVSSGTDADTAPHPGADPPPSAPDVPPRDAAPDPRTAPPDAPARPAAAGGRAPTGDAADDAARA